MGLFPLTRRSLMAGAAAATAASRLAGQTSKVGGANRQSRLWYRQPAREWVEALPVGNGRLGAMIFGGVDEERLQLNKDTLWTSGPYDPVNPQALGTLARSRSTSTSSAGTCAS